MLSPHASLCSLEVFGKLQSSALFLFQSWYYPFSISLNYNRESVEGYITELAPFFSIVAFTDQKIPSSQALYFYRWSLEEKYKIYYMWTVKACKKSRFFPSIFLPSLSGWYFFLLIPFFTCATLHKVIPLKGSPGTLNSPLSRAVTFSSLQLFQRLK